MTQTKYPFKGFTACLYSLTFCWSTETFYSVNDFHYKLWTRRCFTFNLALKVWFNSFFRSLHLFSLHQCRIISNFLIASSWKCICFAWPWLVVLSWAVAVTPTLRCNPSAGHSGGSLAAAATGSWWTGWCGRWQWRSVEEHWVALRVATHWERYERQQNISDIHVPFWSIDLNLFNLRLRQDRIKMPPKKGYLEIGPPE